MDTFSIETSFPPSLAGMPLLAMMVQTAGWVLTLLCLQWIYSIIDDNNTAPAPRGSYVRVSRGVKIRLLIGALALILPRLVQVAAWQMLTPAAREILAVLTWAILIPIAATIAVAWWKDRAARPHESGYIRHARFIEVAPPTIHEKTRGAIGLILIIGISFSTTFVRLDPRDVPVPPDIVGKQ